MPPSSIFNSKGLASLLLKLAIFGLIIAAVQLVLYPLELQGSFRRKGTLDKHLANKVDVLYFGGSTVHSTHISDKNPVPTSNMLGELLPQHRVGRVSRYSFHMDLFRYFVDYVIRAEHHPQWIVIPVNLATFGPEFDKQPSWQFEKKKLILAHGHNPFFRIAYKALLTFKAFDMSISTTEYMNTPVYLYDKPVGILKDFTNPDYFKNTTDQYVKNKITTRYLYKLTAEHRKLQSMLHIADQLKQTPMKPVFYITPIDYEAGVERMGPIFLDIVKRNAAVVAELLAQRDIPLLDLSLSVKHEDFNWDKYLNEHMKEKGRMTVAQALAQYIQP